MGNKCSKKKIQKQIAADEEKQIELKQQQQQSSKVINGSTAQENPAKQIPPATATSQVKNVDEKSVNKVTQQLVTPISDPNENKSKQELVTKQLENVTVSVSKQNLNVKVEEFARLENVVIKLPEPKTVELKLSEVATPNVKLESSTNRLISESSKAAVGISRAPEKHNNYKEDDLEEELGLKLSNKRRATTFVGENELKQARQHYFSMSDSEILPKMTTSTATTTPTSDQINSNNSESNLSTKIAASRKTHNHRRALSDIDPRYRKVHKLYEPLQVHLESFEERVLKAMEVVAEYEKNNPVARVEIIDDDH